MLLIDHGEPQPCENHAFLHERVGTRDELDAAGGQAVEHLTPLMLSLTSGQARDRKPQRRRECVDGCGMLLSQNLGGGHQRRLGSAVHGSQHRRRGHDRLARANVALQQPAHGPAAREVTANLLERPALGPGWVEGQSPHQSRGQGAR